MTPENIDINMISQLVHPNNMMTSLPLFYYIPQFE